MMIVQEMSEFRKCYVKTPLGQMLAVGKSEVLIGLWFEGQKYFPEELERLPYVAPAVDIFIPQLEQWLTDYFNNRRGLVYPRLEPRGTDFQRVVWTELLQIPRGETYSYSDIATGVAKRLCKERISVRAVATAIGHNPISILIPCHRVIGKDGALHGYAGGLSRKQFLLKLEAEAISFE